MPKQTFSKVGKSVGNTPKKSTKTAPIMQMVNDFYNAGDSSPEAVETLIDLLKNESSKVQASWKSLVKELNSKLAGKALLFTRLLYTDKYNSVLFVKGVGYSKGLIEDYILISGIQYTFANSYQKPYSEYRTLTYSLRTSRVTVRDGYLQIVSNGTLECKYPIATESVYNKHLADAIQDATGLLEALKDI